MTSESKEAVVCVFSCLFCCSSPQNVALFALFSPRSLQLVALLEHLGLKSCWIIVISPLLSLSHPDMKETSFVICIFMPECIFQAWIWILWVVWSLSAVVSWSARHSFHLQPSMYVFIRTFSSALPPPASPVWAQPPVKTQTQHRVVNKLMFELFLWVRLTRASLLLQIFSFTEIIHQEK